MSMLSLGLAFGGGHARLHALGRADRVRARRRRGRLHGHLHAGRLARHDHPERLRGDGEHHPALDPALHPEGRGDRPLARRPGPLRGAARLDEPRARRPGHRQRVRLRAVRGDGRIEPGDLLGDRLGRHPRDAKARLLAGLRGRHHRRRRHARHPAAAVDHDDPLRGRRRAVARPAVPGRHRPGRAAGRPVRRLRRAALPHASTAPRAPCMRATAPPRRCSTSTSSRCARRSRCCRACCPSWCC